MHKAQLMPLRMCSTNKKLVHNDSNSMLQKSKSKFHNLLSHLFEKNCTIKLKSSHLSRKKFWKHITKDKKIVDPLNQLNAIIA